MSDTCGRCGRRLKDPFFREIGYGRTCAAKLGITLPQKKKKGKRTDAQEEKDRFVVTTTTETAHSKKN